MKRKIHFSLPLLKRRVAAACLFVAAVFCLLCSGFGSPFSWPGAAAVAESSPFDTARLPAGVTRDAALYLRSTVDATALVLGGALSATGLADEERKDILAASLSDLTFKLSRSVYFTAWQGTRMVHSPMSPDAAGMDFAESLDARGVAFVRRVEEAAVNGGGFVGVLLPGVPAGNGGHGSVVSGPVEQMIYSRPLPHSEWHLAAFLPYETPETGNDGAHLEGSPRDDLLQRGLRLSGLSLAGLACLLLMPGAGRKEE